MVKYPKNIRKYIMDFWLLQALVALLGFAVAAVYVFYKYLKRRQ